MPTIDNLSVAAAAADNDVLPISQGGSLHKITRVQMLAGMQPQIAIGQGQLLGRSSAGSGVPEALGVGANLTLAGGVLSAATSALNVAALPAGAVPSAADLVPIAQGGRNVAVSYGQLLGGMAGVDHVDVSQATVTPSGLGRARLVADIAADAVQVEAFGAKGDGVSDDTAAFAAAVAAGVPLRLGAKTYVINGQFTIARSGVMLLGVPGLSVLRRGAQAGNGAWIAVQGDRFAADGVVFDANGAAVAVESWGVQVASSCLHADFHRCAFRNSYGATLGCGLVFLASDPLASEHQVRDCSFDHNAAHGLWIQACGGVMVRDCRAHDNAGFGIVADFNDAAFVRKARLVQISDSSAWANQRGISVGNYNVTNVSPPVWGNANPDAISVLVSNNICHDNAIYGIAVAGQGLAVLGNILSGNGTGIANGGGLLVNAAASLVADNVIVGSATFGIDCGGSQRLDVRNNAITGCAYGINCGGGLAIRVEDNSVQDFTVAGICVANVETDANGLNFNQSSSQTSIAGNWIGMNGAAGGVWLRDGPRAVLVARNHFVGTSDVGNCLWADTDGVIVEANRYNFNERLVVDPVGGSGQQIVVPDIADSVVVTSTAVPVVSMISTRQAQQSGRISFIRVTAGGSGYSHATVAIGGPGSGAAATAFLSNGSVIGVMIVAAGANYGVPGTVVAVTIGGDGAGATAVGYAGPPLPEGRRVRVRCECPMSFVANSGQQNWTGADLSVPAGAEVEWTAVSGSWRASRSLAANALGGPLHLTAPGESAGCTSGMGRGSPEGVVSANPGSDWRNLDGGVGATWWVKRVGSGVTGWAAVA